MAPLIPNQGQLRPFEEYAEVGLKVWTEEEGRVLWIVFDRPTKMNSLSWPLTTMFHEICDRLMMNRTIRVVCLAGEGRNFSAGLDFGSTWKDVYTPPDPSIPVPSYFGQRQYSLMATKLFAIPQMVVAAAHGPTVGVGFALFCAADVRIVSEDWRASIGANRMGLSGGEGGLSWLLPRLVGMGLTTELMATHRWVDAPRALQRGLLNEIVKTKDELRDAARRFAKDMLALSPTGLILTKQLISLVANGASMQGAVAAEDSAQMMASADPEALAMLRAFQGGIMGGNKGKDKAKI
ncbi:ClpP/crotonase-like domain-containing protein [Hyaloraphidium curvatum]|nr:ClpP/crotonase-like domain-containing protein [Hyaloraphidium curvatum]